MSDINRLMRATKQKRKSDKRSVSSIGKTSVYFQPDVKIVLDDIVSEVQRLDLNYSRSIFIERAVQREIKRLRGDLPSKIDRSRH